MKRLNFLILSGFLTFAVSSQAQKLYCYGADSHPYDEAGTNHSYFVGLDFDTTAGTAKIWKQVDKQPTKIFSGKSFIHEEQSYVLFSTIHELDLLVLSIHMISIGTRSQKYTMGRKFPRAFSRLTPLIFE